MARILPDKEVRRLFGTVLRDFDESLLDPNGIKFRLGTPILFQSTTEERKLKPDQFAKITPGESVMICSLEYIDMREATVRALYPSSHLMALITPTTTMMREGVTQASTKIDSGYEGRLNWGLRNSSTKDLYLGYGEPMFKVTFFELDESESPEQAYGEKPTDSYQGTDGIKRSARRIPADIPKRDVVASTFEKLDPKEALREAGYPFNHVSTELTALHGKWEVVSTDVRVMKDSFETQSKALGTKIDEKSQSVQDKLQLEFGRRIMQAGGAIIASIPIMYGVVTFLQSQSVETSSIASLAIVIGILVGVLTAILTKKRNDDDEGSRS